MNAHSSIAVSRDTLPQQILAWLPLSLFFPVGVMYGGVLLFYISLIVSGGHAQKWQRVRASPMLFPVLILSFITLVIGLTQVRPAGEFWSSFWHYQTYLFLFPFLSIGAGEWQKKALQIFFAGAIYAATLFYLNAMQLLPDSKLFHSYIVYEGNKSILLGILLALAAGWMLHVWRWQKDHALWRAAAFVYVVIALLLLAKTRTASVIFILLCCIMMLRNVRFSWRKSLLLLIPVGFLGMGANYIAGLPAPETCLVTAMRDANMHAADIAFTRGVCTVQQIRDFSQGKKIAEDGMRLEIYKNTLELIAEKPWAGHGIGNWMPLYQAKAKDMMSGSMSTPHNDYLLYCTELGIFGLLALLWIWHKQFVVARKMLNGPCQEHAMLLAMLGITMMVGGMFNAILRDGVFGMALMILLAIPLAGVDKNQEQNEKKNNIDE
ncbi:MAG: O-antigen ligase family protein [Pseudomonadota bacterium]